MSQTDRETGKRLYVIQLRYITRMIVSLPFSKHVAKLIALWALVIILFLASLVLAPADQQSDIGYNALQVNYELLTKIVDPEDILGSSFSCKLISFEEKTMISSVQDERGKRRACQKMLDILLQSWKRGYCERFIQVLKNCNYEECAAQLQSN